jgi:hypothetical protein
MGNMDATHSRHHGRLYKLKRWFRDKRNNTAARLVLLYIMMIVFFGVMVLLSKVW